jgi:hypothetical protein
MVRNVSLWCSCILLIQPEEWKCVRVSDIRLASVPQLMKSSCRLRQAALLSVTLVSIAFKRTETFHGRRHFVALANYLALLLRALLPKFRQETSARADLSVRALVYYGHHARASWRARCRGIAVAWNASIEAAHLLDSTFRQLTES